MKRGAIIAAVAFALLGAFIFIAAPSNGHEALAIDEIHWQGNPVAPCFVDAFHCGGHALGLDENGRDIVARLIVGGSVTLGTALLALLIELALAFALAFISWRSGWVIDRIIVAFGEGMSALPRVPFALVLVGITLEMMPRGAWPNSIEIAAWFGVIFWPAAFVLFRARSAPIDLARRAIGDLMTIVLVLSTIEFFGYGHMPPTPTWGNMLANAQANIQDMWWAALFPGLCIFLTVLLLDIVRRGLPATRRIS